MEAWQDYLNLYNSVEIKKLKRNSKQYHEQLKQFLSNFKVHLCTQQTKHNPQTCYSYHDQSDRRRNPYSSHHFAYNIFQICSCSQPQCPRIHNQYESLYHPLLYKTNPCQKGNMCEFGFYCYYSHPEDIHHFAYGQFFRFDLRTFKTQKCYNKNLHQRKTCLYFHNDKDKRRYSNIIYNHFLCGKEKCNNQLCQFSHNKLQQLYHPDRYKTKFCQFYPNNIDKCDYKSFCSFAHTQGEIIENIELIHLLEKNNDFYINKFKTVWCPFTQNHEREKCVYAHNIQDFRRNPKQYIYDSVRCESWNFGDAIKSIQEGNCKLGMQCKKSHGWMEQKYHPSKYSTKKSNSLKKQDIQVAEKIVNKKILDFPLLNDIKSKGKGNTNPQILKSNFSKGTPFFKNDKSSEHSVKTKAKSRDVESDKSIDGGSSKNQVKTVGTNIIMPPLLKNLDGHPGDEQEKIDWSTEFDLQKKQQKTVVNAQNSARSKSAQKSNEYEASYSKSIIDAFEDKSIIKIFQKQNINEIQIMNMNQSKIEKMSFLTSDQKNNAVKGLKKYNIKQIDAITYSKQLTKHFIKNKKQTILQKMQIKKVKQTKLLKLAAKQINDLSFLESEEKIALPKLLKQFLDYKEFKELNQRIEEETKMK